MTSARPRQRLLPRSEFVRNVGLLASGTVIGQLVMVLTTPLLTRLYTPEQFGVLAVFMALMSTITVVVCLRFEMAIPLPRRNGAAFQVVGLALSCLALMVAALVALGFGPGQWLLRRTSLSVLIPYYWLLPLGIFFGGTYQLSSMWAVRSKAFGVLAKTKVQQGVGGAATQLGMGFLKFGPVGLILGQMIGQGLGMVRLSRNLGRDYRAQPVRVTRRGMTWAMRRYRQFMRYDMPASLINTAGAQVPSLLFAAYFSPALAGIYLLSVRILSAPMTLVGKTMMQVLLPDIVEARHLGNLSYKVKKLQRMLSALGLGPFLVIALLAPMGFGHIFGNRWEGAGGVAAWTALWVGVQFIYSPLSVVLLAVEAQRTNLLLQISLFAVRFCAIYMSHAMHAETLAVAWFSLVSAIHYTFGIVTVGWRAGLSLNSAISEVFRSSFLALLVALPTAAAVLLSFRISLLIAAVIISITFWLIHLYLMSRPQKQSRFGNDKAELNKR